jgi:hypothetical protein
LAADADKAAALCWLRGGSGGVAGEGAAAASPSEIGRRKLRLQQSIHQELKEAKHMYILQVAGSHAWSRAEPPQ